MGEITVIDRLTMCSLKRSSSSQSSMFVLDDELKRHEAALSSEQSYKVLLFRKLSKLTDLNIQCERTNRNIGFHWTFYIGLSTG